MIVKDDYINEKGYRFQVRNICCDQYGITPRAFGKVVAETPNNGSSSDGSYLVDTVTIYKPDELYLNTQNDLGASYMALRVYDDVSNFRCGVPCIHDDEYLVSTLQERQKYVKLTDFPTGIVTVRGHVVGQEIPFYENHLPISKMVTEKHTHLQQIEYYLSMLRILKELLANEIIYSDIHGNNFMVSKKDGSVKLIDFEKRFVHFNQNKEQRQQALSHLKLLLLSLNDKTNLKFNEDIMKMNDFEDLEKHIIEEQKVLKNHI